MFVMMSEEAYNNLMENVYVMGNKANYDWLIESKRSWKMEILLLMHCLRY